MEHGIQLMKASEDLAYKNVLDIAWQKFHINFNINLMKTVPDGIEAFGFASRFNDPYVEQRLLNAVPLLRHFTKIFREKNKKIFQLLEDNQVNLFSEFGPVFYERPKAPFLPCNRNQLLRKMGFHSILSLTPRELDILKYFAHGYPSTYIAKQLHLCRKTVENYTATIKCKLSCSSKVELIQMAQELASTGYFELA